MIRRMDGAATSTTGSMVAHESSHKENQWRTKPPWPMREALATKALTAQVSPDWITPNTTCW